MPTFDIFTRIFIDATRKFEKTLIFILNKREYIIVSCFKKDVFTVDSVDDRVLDKFLPCQTRGLPLRR